MGWAKIWCLYINSPCYHLSPSIIHPRTSWFLVNKNRRQSLKYASRYDLSKTLLNFGSYKQAIWLRRNHKLCASRCRQSLLALLFDFKYGKTSIYFLCCIYSVFLLLSLDISFRPSCCCPCNSISNMQCNVAGQNSKEIDGS